MTFVFLLVLVAHLAVFSHSVAGSSQFTRCKMISGHPGLCVAPRFCRIRTITLIPCAADDSPLFCCPFPTNDSFIWSVEERDSYPIIFPKEPSKPIPHDESVDIVFPQEDVLRSHSTFPSIQASKPRSTPAVKVLPTSTTKIPQTTRGVQSKSLNTTSRERNPNESEHEKEFFDDDDQIMFEVIPKPKPTTQKPVIVPVPKDEFTTVASFQKTQNSLNVHEMAGGFEHNRGAGVVKTTASAAKRTTQRSSETSTNIALDKLTYGPFDSVDTNKAMEPACGHAPFTPFIAGGTESRPNQWPWMAAIFQRFTTARPNKFLCGGSLISTRYILTAAHCCVSGSSSVALPASAFLVRMGSSAMHEGDSFSIAKVKVHSNFSYTGQFNDIALLRLPADMPSYNDRIAPVCLPYPTLLDTDLVNHKATVVGWGAMSLGGEHQETLHEVTVPIVSTDDCALAYSRIRSAAFLARGSTHVLCAGLKEGGKDSCKSDSGGPLMIPLNNDRWTIIGIVSFGYRCAEPGFPGVYTRITHYLEWIYTHTQD